MLKFTPPPTLIAAKLLSKLQNLSPVVKQIGANHVKDLQDNIINEGGDPDTGAAWKALSSAYVEHKRLMGYFLTILRRTDALRGGIHVVEFLETVYRISVTGDAKSYFAYVNAKRKFLGMSGETKRQAKLTLGRYLKGK